MSDTPSAIVGQIPLYRSPSLTRGTGNAGLYFDKFCKVLDPSKPGAKALWLKTDFLGSNALVGNSELIAEHVQRQEKLILRLGGRSFRIKTAGRFVTGLGYRHQLENGFAWHPILGTPYLPGSGLKGLARAWAKFVGADEQLIKRIFGPRGNGVEHAVGSVIFLDAIPTRVVKLVEEVMTPHYRGDKPPADVHDPTPIPFLAVDKGVEFIVGVLPRGQDDTNDVDQAWDWLGEALEDLGAGAKRGVGYGRFERLDVRANASAPASKVVKDKPVEPERLPEPTMLPAFFEVEFVDFAEAREARKTARERKKKGKEPKFREFDVRPTNPAFAKLAGKLVCSSRDTVGYDLPFEDAERHAGAARPFYVGKLDERDGTKVARMISLTLREE